MTDEDFSMSAENRGKGLFGDGNGDAAYIRDTLTVIAAAGMFIGGWFHAISAWGWFLGLAFGWLPAGMLAAIAGFVVHHLWWLVLGVVGVIILLDTFTS